MSYELPCGCIFASLDACAFALLGTSDIASHVEIYNNREKNRINVVYLCNSL